MEKLEKEGPTAPREGEGSDGLWLAEENEVRLSGRLLKPPKVTAHGNDNLRAQFMLAVTRSWRREQSKRGRETSYVPVVAWRAGAEACRALGRGSAVRLEGRLRTWQSQGRRYRWEVQAHMLEVVRNSAAPKKDGAAASEQPELLPN